MNMADTFVEFADYNKSNLYLGTKQQLRSRRLSTTACAWSPRSQLLFGPRQATRSVVGGGGGGGGESALHLETQQRLRRRLTCGPRLILE